jgi:WD40 repeat protein/uncharacterized caspase-like protein
MMSVMPSEVSALETGHAKLWILLVGVNEYYDRRLPSLQYSTIDCQGVADALTHATQKFPTSTIRVHHDMAELAPTLGSVRDSLEDMVENAQPEDTVLFYFCGHSGLESRFQQAVLCLADTEKEGLLKTGLSLMSLLGQLSRCAAKQQILWLDLFHGNGMTLQDGLEGQLPFDSPAWQLSEMLRQHTIAHPGFSALLSCDAAQRTRGAQPQQSWKFPELGQSVFAHCLIEGLRGAAANSQGVIDANGVAKYVSEQTLQFINRANADLRRLHEPTSHREGLLLSPKYLVQTPKPIGQTQASCVLGLKLPDVLESIVSPTKSETIAKVIPFPLEPESTRSTEPETVNRKAETPETEVSSTPAPVEISEAPISELISDLVIEPVTEDDLDQVERSTEPVTESISEITQPPAELQFEPVIGSVVEQVEISEAPVSEFVSDLMIESIPEDDLDQDETLTEPVFELTFDSVIGSVADSVETSEELVSELVSDLVVEPLTEEDLDQTEIATDSEVEAGSELIFDSVIGAVVDPVETEEPTAELVSDLVIEPVAEDDLDRIAQTEIGTEPVEELAFESVIGAVEDDFNQAETSTDLASEPLVEFVESDLEPVETSSIEFVSESNNLEENQVDATANEGIDEPIDDDLSSFIKSVHKAVGKATNGSIPEPITHSDIDSDFSSSIPEISQAPQTDQPPRSNRWTRNTQTEQPARNRRPLYPQQRPNLCDRINGTLDSIQRSSRDAANAGQAIYQHHAPGLQQAVIATLDRLSRSTYEIVQTTLESLRNPRTQKIVIAAIAGIGLTAVGLTGFALYQQRNAQLKAIQSLSSNATSLLSTNRATEALIDALKAGEQLQQVDQPWNFVPELAKFTTIATLQQAIVQFNAPTTATLEAGLRNITMSADAKTFAVVTSKQLIELWQHEGTQFKRLDLDLNGMSEAHQAPITQIRFSPDGKILASASEDKTIKLWDAEQGILLKTLTGHTDLITAISFRSDGGVLASASRDRTIKLWGIPSGDTLDTFKGQEGDINVITFSPDGRVLSAGSTNQAIYLWFPDSNKPILLGRHQANTPGSGSQGITDLAFSSDGKTIASASWNDAIRIWIVSDAKSEQVATPRQTFNSNTTATSLSFSPDTKWLAAGGQNGTISLWDLQNSNLVKTLSGHQGSVRNVAFSSDGKALTSVSDRNGILLWDFTLSPLMKQGCNLVQNELRTNPLLQNTNLCRSHS